VNREETSRLLAVLTAHWTNHPVPNPQGTLPAYQVGLADIPYELGMAAAERAIETATFFPTVAELRRLAAEELFDMPTAEEALAEVRQAIAWYGLYRQPVWSCRPVAEAVRLYGWRRLCLGEEGDAGDARQFAATYRVAVKRTVEELDFQAAWAERQEAAIAGAAVPPVEAGRERR
jgi:hypothetical protein